MSYSEAIVFYVFDDYLDLKTGKLQAWIIQLFTSQNLKKILKLVSYMV